MLVIKAGQTRVLTRHSGGYATRVAATRRDKIDWCQSCDAAIAEDSNQMINVTGNSIVAGAGDPQNEER
jgi:hypothetical protein